MEMEMEMAKEESTLLVVIIVLLFLLGHRHDRDAMRSSRRRVVMDGMDGSAEGVRVPEV